MLWEPTTKRKNHITVLEHTKDPSGEIVIRPLHIMGEGDPESESYTSRNMEYELLSMSRDRMGVGRHTSPKRPSLDEILADSSPSPWTLKAFTSYCAKNMCLENLNFVIDARAYQRNYAQWRVDHPNDTSESSDDSRFLMLNGMWKRMLREYITPNGLQEVNLSASVRDKLISIPETKIPPEPEVLLPAIRQTRGLIEDSILLSFLNEILPHEDPLDRSEVYRGKSNAHRIVAPQILPSSSGNTSSSQHRPLPSHPRQAGVISPPPTRGKPFFSKGESQGPKEGAEEASQSSPSLSAPSSHQRSQSPAGGSIPNLSQRDRRPSPWSRNDVTWKKLSSKLGLKKRPSGQLLKASEQAVEEEDDSEGRHL